MWLGARAGVDRSCQHELMVGGSDITPDRETEIAGIIEAVTAWAHTRPDIQGVVVVGSWARGTSTMSSDIDIVLLTNDPATNIVSTGWWGFLGRAELIATRQWGPLTERRVAFPPRDWRSSSGLFLHLGQASIRPTLELCAWPVTGCRSSTTQTGYCERSSVRPPNSNSGTSWHPNMHANRPDIAP